MVPPFLEFSSLLVNPSFLSLILQAHSRAIEHFQESETPTFIKHIEAGLKLLGETEGGLLVFSG